MEIFNETGHNQSLASTDESDGIESSSWTNKGFSTKPDTNISYSRVSNWSGFEGHGSKVKATDYIFQVHFRIDSDVLLVVLQRGKKSKVKRKMHPQRLPVEFYLAIVVAVVKFVLVPFARWKRHFSTYKSDATVARTRASSYLITNGKRKRTWLCLLSETLYHIIDGLLCP